MLYVNDKAKALFSETVNGEYKLKKAKMLAVSLIATSEKANTYFLSPSGKMPAHFVLDGSTIVKYAYNTTNVFPINTKWSLRSKHIVEAVDLELPAEITSHVKITSQPLVAKTYTASQVPQQITLYYSNNTADDFYTYLERREIETAYHYLIDDEVCYEIVPPNIACYTPDQIHVVVLGKKNIFDVYDRAAKLISQLMNSYNLTQYMPVTEENHIHALPAAYFQSIEERLAVLQTTGGTSETAPTSIRKDDANPGDHIIHISALYSSVEDFPRIEKALISFVAEYLYYFEMDTSSVWRLTDLVTNTGTTEYYNQKFDLFLNCVEEALAQLKKGVRQIEVSVTGLPDRDEEGYVIIYPFIADFRNMLITTSFLTNDQKSLNQDYDASTIGANVELRSKFEDGAGAFSETVKISSCYYEPVYPDLTVPPRNTTMLYNKGLLEPKEILKEMDQPEKPVIGKTPNAFDPYPIDDKIAQLEMHTPIVTLEYENAGDVQTNLFNYVSNRFGNTEKRLVRLENILSTFMRYQARLASRVNINCVYYGGQSVFGKYDGIRCMCDDLTNDADTRTLDQCLNCSRYEPILGQFYEITGESPGMAQIYDDVQAARLTKEEFANLNNVTDYSDPHEETEEDVTTLHLRHDGEKGYDELLDEANNFEMNWTETPYHKQSPHISLYQYDPYEIYHDKKSRLEAVYEDGYREMQQLKFERPQYSMNSLGGGNFNPATSEVNGLNDLYDLSDYVIDANDVRLKIISLAQEAVALGKKGQALYTLGAKVKSQYMTCTPQELYNKICANEEVNQFVMGRGSDNTLHKAVYFDCSSFASYLYIHCGLIKQAFTTSTLPNFSDFSCVLTNGASVLEQIKKAYPGDLLLFNGHVTIYAGGDYQFEAAGDEGMSDTEQVVCSKIRTSGFKGIYRHKDLTALVVKNKETVAVSSTLEDYLTLQSNKNTGRDINGDGYIDYAKTKETALKADWLTNKEVLRNYIDPNKRLTPELKMQFASIKDLSVPGVIMEDTINNFLVCLGSIAMKKVRGIKADNDYNPVRDDDGNLIWEEKYVFPRGDVWLAAAEKSGLNPLFLLIYCAIETNWCTNNNWTNYSEEFKAKNSDNYLFNAFNIWCTDEEYFPNQPALHRVTAKRKTEENQWFTLEKSIVEGAKYIADTFLGRYNTSIYGRRDTAYFMKWHLGKLIDGQKGEPGTQQVTTDVTWPDKYAALLYAALKHSPMGREEALKYFTYYVPRFSDENSEVITAYNTASGDKTYLGEFEITFYCACSKCCGQWADGITACGEKAVQGVTIAVDRSVIPLGQWVEIEGLGKRKAMDTGGAIKGNRIDVYMDDHNECLKMGRLKGVKVYSIS